MFIRTKTAKGRTYYQIVEGFRENGKVCQRIVLSLGQNQDPADALDALKWTLKRLRSRVSRYGRIGEEGRLSEVAIKDLARLRARIADIEPRIVVLKNVIRTGLVKSPEPSKSNQRIAGKRPKSGTNKGGLDLVDLSGREMTAERLAGLGPMKDYMAFLEHVQSVVPELLEWKNAGVTNSSLPQKRHAIFGKRDRISREHTIAEIIADLRAAVVWIARTWPEQLRGDLGANLIAMGEDVLNNRELTIEPPPR